MYDSFELCRWCGTSSYIATQSHSPWGRLLQATSLDATPLLIAVGGAECLHKRRIKVFHQLDIWATQEQYVKLLSFCITLSYLTTRQSLIGHSGWALPHYTGMGHCSCSFLRQRQSRLGFEPTTSRFNGLEDTRRPQGNRFVVLDVSI